MNQTDSTKPRLGLALSGGGFRASFFHIGVLARLAETGLLSQVQVISTVSGGSIIGALYYLHVKKLLEAKADAEITDVDYVCLVSAMEKEFLGAVQNNLRVRMWSNVLKNFKMCRANYSRSDRMGELYDEYFYQDAMPREHGRMIRMNELYIRPGGSDFNPLEQNEPRVHKVPILLINATALNTGHNWRFEAKTMGESPPPETDKPFQDDIDKNMRLERPDTYAKMTKAQQDVELGIAVAASAGVPGLFAPMAITGLYENVRVQLVDGGVHDNQGVEGLVEKICTHFVVSDGSGQMGDRPNAETQIISVLTRSSDIMSDRVREEELLRLRDRLATNGDARRDPDMWKKFAAFMHLRRGLFPPTKDWIGEDEKEDNRNERDGDPRPSLTAFGVHTQIQDRLSRLRTDLDTFTDVEAFSLMLDGYLMSQAETERLRKTLMEESAPPVADKRWRFLQIQEYVTGADPDLKLQLEVGASRLFKLFRLYVLGFFRRHGALSKNLLGILSVAAIWLLYRVGVWVNRDCEGWTPHFSGNKIYIAAVGIAIVAAILLIPKFRTFFKKAPRDKWYHPTVLFLNVLTSPANLLCVTAAWFHLSLVDPIFRRRGSIGHLMKSS